MENKRVYPYHVELNSVDFTARMTLAGLGDCLLTTSSLDASTQGFGNGDIDGNVGWILLRLAMDVDRLPNEDEELKVATWVSDANRLATTRNMEVIDSEGIVVARAVTQWAVLDLEKRCTLNLNEVVDNARIIQEIPSPTTPPARLSQPESVTRFTHQVLYSYVDRNGHTYSINYLRMVLDTLPFETLQRRSHVRVDMNFIHETRYGERLTIVTDSGQLNPQFEILSGDSTPACRISIVWD